MKAWSVPVPDPSNDPYAWPDLMVVASTILGEAEGESLAGKRAVAFTIMNRAADSRWPDTPGDVCLQRWQFSCWNPGSPRFAPMMHPQKHTREDIWTDCFRAACEAFWSLEPDNSLGANHYHATSIDPPKWADQSKVTNRVGRHIFYRL